MGYDFILFILGSSASLANQTQPTVKLLVFSFSLLVFHF